MSNAQEEEGAFERSTITPRSPVGGDGDEPLAGVSNADATDEPLHREKDESDTVDRLDAHINAIKHVVEPKGKVGAAGRDLVLSELNKIRGLMIQLSAENAIMKERLHAFDPVFAEIKNDIKQIKYEISGDLHGKALKKPYAEIVREPVTKDERTYAILITGKQEVADPCTIEREIKDKIKLGPIGVAISRIRRTRRNGLLILCPTENDAKLLAEVINERFQDEYKAELLRKRWPRVLIKNVSGDYQLENLETDIKLQNPELFDPGEKDSGSVINVKKVFTTKSSDTETHVLLELPPDVARRLMRKQRISLGYQRLAVVEGDRVLQCYHCLRAGHIARNCSDGSNPPRCTACGGEHGFKTCNRKTEVPNCVNCSRENALYKNSFRCDHSAIDRDKCEYLKKMFKIMKQKIEY
jgi:hypothetical protein